MSAKSAKRNGTISMIRPTRMRDGPSKKTWKPAHRTGAAALPRAASCSAPEMCDQEIDESPHLGGQMMPARIKSEQVGRCQRVIFKHHFQSSRFQVFGQI